MQMTTRRTTAIITLAANPTWQVRETVRCVYQPSSSSVQFSQPARESRQTQQHREHCEKCLDRRVETLDPLSMA